MPLTHYATNNITDINECSKNNGDCNQNCKNVDGSYNCFCMDGYKLARDGKMCEGMYIVLGLAGLLFFFYLKCLNQYTYLNMLDKFMS